MTDKKTSSSEEIDHRAVLALTSKLADLAEQAPSHRVMLIALITTFKAVAVVHPCCTHAAAQAALKVGGELLVEALDNASTHIVH